MGYVSKRTSDISGEIVSDDAVITVVVRSLGKLFDVTAEELLPRKRVTDVVELELRHPDVTSEEVIVTKADFDKLVTPEVLANADSIRGSRIGYRPAGD